MKPSKPKHTQGPWTISKNKEFIGSKSERELFTPRQATNADIRLVKAAPDMLEALDYVERILYSRQNIDDGLNEAFEIVQAAIRKAKGETV